MQHMLHNKRCVNYDSERKDMVYEIENTDVVKHYGNDMKRITRYAIKKEAAVY